jgi:hypothetical protein
MNLTTGGLQNRFRRKEMDLLIYPRKTCAKAENAEDEGIHEYLPMDILIDDSTIAEHFHLAKDPDQRRVIRPS